MHVTTDFGMRSFMPKYTITTQRVECAMQMTAMRGNGTTFQHVHMLKARHICVDDASGYEERLISSTSSINLDFNSGTQKIPPALLACSLTHLIGLRKGYIGAMKWMGGIVHAAFTK